MELYHQDVSQSDGEESKEKPIVGDSGRLEDLSRKLTCEVVDLMQTKKASRPEVSSRIIALEAKILPESVLHLSATQRLHNFVLLIKGDRV